MRAARLNLALPLSFPEKRTVTFQTPPTSHRGFNNDSIAPFHAALPPRTAPAEVQEVEIQGVQVGKAGKQGGAAAMKRRFYGVNPVFFINHAGHATYDLRPDNRSVHPQVCIAFEIAQPMRAPYQAVTDNAAPVREDNQIAALEFIIGDGLHFHAGAVPQNRVHTAPLNARNGSPAPLEGFPHGASAIGIFGVSDDQFSPRFAEDLLRIEMYFAIRSPYFPVPDR